MGIASKAYQCGLTRGDEAAAAPASLALACSQGAISATRSLVIRVVGSATLIVPTGRCELRS